MSEHPPILQIDLASPVAAYEQITSRLRILLVAGTLRPGTQLPTVRQVATDLGVHHNTVAEAYRILAEEGWLDLRRRRGAIVIERPPREATAETEAKFAHIFREQAARAISEGVPATAIARELDALAREIREGGFQ